MDRPGDRDPQHRGLTEVVQAARLIQMATGSGKTFTAANLSYRLIKFADARRILFLVDRANLGRQTAQGVPGVHHTRRRQEVHRAVQRPAPSGGSIDRAARVTISTIQRLYALLKGEELAPELDEESAYEVEPSKPVEVTTTPAHLIVLGHSPLERIEPFGEFRAVVRAGRVVTVRRVIRARPA